MAGRLLSIWPREPGGKKGLLVITGRGRTICGKPQVASDTLGAQSGKRMVGTVKLTTPCPKVKHEKAKRTGKPKKR